MQCTQVLAPTRTLLASRRGSNPNFSWGYSPLYLKKTTNERNVSFLDTDARHGLAISHEHRSLSRPHTRQTASLCSSPYPTGLGTTAALLLVATAREYHCRNTAARSLRTLGWLAQFTRSPQLVGHCSSTEESDDGSACRTLIS